MPAISRPILGRTVKIAGMARSHETLKTIPTNGTSRKE